MRFAAPQRRWLGAGRGWGCERPYRAKQGADRALRRPAQQRDKAAWATDAHELVGDRLVLGREHRADRGHDDVERLVGKRELLGVGLGPVERQARGLGTAAALVEELGREVGSGHLRACCGGGQGGVAGAGSYVEHCHPGAMPQAATSCGPKGSKNVSTIDG